MCECQDRCPHGSPPSHQPPYQDPHQGGFGKVLLVWGLLLPMITLPYTLFDTYPLIPLLDKRVTIAGFEIGSLVLSYQDVISGSLVLIALGISSLVLPPPGH